MTNGVVYDTIRHTKETQPLLPAELGDDEIDSLEDLFKNTAPEGTLVTVFHRETELDLVIVPGYCAITMDNQGNRQTYGLERVGFEDKPSIHVNEGIRARAIWFCPDPTATLKTGFTGEKMARMTMKADGFKDTWDVVSYQTGWLEEREMRQPIK